MSDAKLGSWRWLDEVPVGKIRACQHIPSFVDGAEPHFGEYSDTADLLSQDWVRRWNRGMDGWRFYRWSKTGDGMLMAEYDHGDNWWVVANVRGNLDLPLWEMSERGKAGVKEWNEHGR